MPIVVQPAAPPGVGPGVPGTILQRRVATLGSVTFGAVDALGTYVYLTDVKGWSGGTGTTGQVDQRVAQDGGWPSPANRTPRTIELDVTLRGASFEQVEASISAIVAAIPLATLDELLVNVGDSTLTAAVRQGDGDILQSQKGPAAVLSIPLVAPDPRRYSVEQVTASTGLPQTTGGLSLNNGSLSLPLSVGATLSSGVLRVTNSGNIETPPTLVVRGPCPAFTLSLRRIDANGTPHPAGRLQFADPIAAGRSLVIDSASGRALLDGTATRTVTGTVLGAFTYAPGNNEVSFSASTYDAAALLTSTHRDAWK